jgi:hypothetical protein
MVRYLFWNYRYDGPDREELLARLIRAEAVDVAILAESSVDRAGLINQLGSDGRSFSGLAIPHEWIEIFAGYPADCFLDYVRDEGRLCLRRLKVPGRVDILLGAVHLVSGLHRERSERKAEADPLARAVRAAQREPAVGHERTILVGDFNLNPFDEGMICPSGFGAMMTKGLVRKNRGVSGGIGGRLYNPIWSRLGREVEDAPPGTYYWSDVRELNIYWNYLDQVLIGADLLDHSPAERLRILTSVPGANGPLPLIRETGRHWVIELSDHLPLVFDLDRPPEVVHHG